MKSASPLRAVALVVAALLVPACVSKKEHDKVKAEAQRLGQDKQKLEGELAAAGAASTEMQGTLDEVSKNLEDLRVKELQVIRSSIAVAKEGKAAPSRRDQLLAEIETIRKSVRENLDKLAQLEKQKKEAEAKAAASSKKVSELSAKNSTLERLITEMRAQLEEKEATITELETKVLELSKTVETQAGTIKQQEGVITEQDTSLHKAFVVIGTKAALKKAGVVEKKGSVLGMGGNWRPTGQMDPTLIREIDIRKETEFALGAPAKKVRVISDHPKDQFEIVPGDDKSSTLKIKDTAAFWKANKYLVVMFN